MNVAMLLLAEAGTHSSKELLDSIGQALTNVPNGGETLIWLSGVLALILLLAIATRVYSRKGNSGSGTDYLTIAVDLLDLNEQDRRDLQKIAKLARIKEPAAMLLSPINLARTAVPVLNLERDTEFNRRIEQLCLRLFDSPLPDPGNLPPNRQYHRP